MEQPFILPQPWTLNVDILTPEQNKIVKTYWKQLPGCTPNRYADIRGHLSSNDGSADGSYMYWGSVPPNPLITFEQFERYVLKVSSQLEITDPKLEIVNQFPIY